MLHTLLYSWLYVTGQMRRVKHPLTHNHVFAADLQQQPLKLKDLHFAQESVICRCANSQGLM